jgi:hypothetical protein
MLSVLLAFMHNGLQIEFISVHKHVSKHPDRSERCAEFVKMVCRHSGDDIVRRKVHSEFRRPSLCFIFYGRIRTQKTSIFIRCSNNASCFLNFPSGTNLKGHFFELAI